MLPVSFLKMPLDQVTQADFQHDNAQQYQRKGTAQFGPLTGIAYKHIHDFDGQQRNACLLYTSSNGNLYFSMRKEIPSRSMDSSSTTKILYITHLLRLKIMKKYFILFSSIQYV